MPVSEPDSVDRAVSAAMQTGHFESVVREVIEAAYPTICADLTSGTTLGEVNDALVEARAEVERLREANVALRQALVRIEDHARRVGDDALAGVALIARDAINAS